MVPKQTLCMKTVWISLCSQLVKESDSLTNCELTDSVSHQKAMFNNIADKIPIREIQLPP